LKLTGTHVSHISGSNGPVSECPRLTTSIITQTVHILQHDSADTGSQYLNVRQRRFGTFITQTVHILQHDIADTGSLPVQDFVKHNSSYFQIIQPGRSTATPPYRVFLYIRLIIIVFNYRE
jgi:hypothetical protein